MVLSTYYTPQQKPKEQSHIAHFKSTFGGVSNMSTKNLPRTLHEVEKAYLKRLALNFLDQKVSNNISKRGFMEKEHIGAGTLSKALQTVGVFPRTFIYEDEQHGGVPRSVPIRERAKRSKKKSSVKGGSERIWEQKINPSEEVIELQKRAGIL